MHDIQVKLCVKNMSDLRVKEIKGIFNSRNPTKQQFEEYKRWADDAFIYICEEHALKIIMNCRVPAAVEFKTRIKIRV